VYGQTQATETDNNNIVRGLSWTSHWYDNSMRPTTSKEIAIAASISDNGNINSTPFLLPSPSSSQSSNNNNNNNATIPAVGPTSNTPPPNNAVNSNSPSQGDNSNNGNSTDTHHVNSHSNTVSSSNNHFQDQHKKHKHSSTRDIIHHVFGQSKQQLTVGDIPFP
ncbi:MAG TPA: hypothetical protein VEL70_03815, partial [Candidatus Acidoferrum sp.]|nr:hypothetical protein [Candidatus Acidoferrum sp.]